MKNFAVVIHHTQKESILYRQQTVDIKKTPRRRLLFLHNVLGTFLLNDIECCPSHKHESQQIHNVCFEKIEENYAGVFVQA